VRPNEEAADDRFADAGLSTPAIEGLGGSEVLDTHARLRPRVSDDVDGCLLSVFQPVSEKVVPNCGRLHAHPFPDASSHRSRPSCALETVRGRFGEHRLRSKPVSSRASEPLLTS
jgi:hypothetical protein